MKTDFSKGVKSFHVRQNIVLEGYALSIESKRVLKSGRILRKGRNGCCYGCNGGHNKTTGIYADILW